MPYTGQGTGTAGNAQPTAAPPTNYFTQAQGLLSSTNPSSQAAGVIAGGQAPTVAGSNLTMAQLLQQIGLAVPNVNETNASSTLGLEYGLGQAGIGEQQLGLQQQGLAAQQGLSQAQQGYEVAGYNLQQQQYPEQLAAQQTANAQALQQLQSSQAIGDTGFTKGGKLNAAAQKQSAANAITDIQRAQAESQLQQGSEVAGYNYSAGDIARSQQNLELTAQANGLSVQQMLAQWQQGLEQTGVQGDPLAAYTQSIAAQTQGVQALGTAAGQEGLLTPNQLPNPGNLSNAAMKGGFNPMTLYAGQVP